VAKRLGSRRRLAISFGFQKIKTPHSMQNSTQQPPGPFLPGFLGENLPPAIISELFTPFQEGRFPLNSEVSDFRIQGGSPFRLQYSGEITLLETGQTVHFWWLKRVKQFTSGGSHVSCLPGDHQTFHHPPQVNYLPRFKNDDFP